MGAHTLRPRTAAGVPPRPGMFAACSPCRRHRPVPAVPCGGPAAARAARRPPPPPRLLAPGGSPPEGCERLSLRPRAARRTRPAHGFASVASASLPCRPSSLNCRCHLRCSSSAPAAPGALAGDFRRTPSTAAPQPLPPDRCPWTAAPPDRCPRTADSRPPPARSSRARPGLKRAAEQWAASRLPATRAAKPVRRPRPGPQGQGPAPPLEPERTADGPIGCRTFSPPGTRGSRSPFCTPRTGGPRPEVNAGVATGAECPADRTTPIGEPAPGAVAHPARRFPIPSHPMTVIRTVPVEHEPLR
jgi:hypothetical protein